MLPVLIALGLFASALGADVGCSKTVKGQHGECVKNGCCNYDFQETSSSLCNGAGETCCYRGLKASCLGGGSGGCSGIEFVSRSEWGARSGRGLSHMHTPVYDVFVHHTESAECHDKASCSVQMRGFQSYHMDHNGWSDIGYNFLIGGDGRVYIGRDWDHIGAHTYGYNSKAIAFSLIGSYMNKSPNSAMLNTLHKVIACGVSKGKIASSYGLYGHRDVNSTDCPGNALYNLLKSWSRWQVVGVKFRKVSVADKVRISRYQSPQSQSRVGRGRGIQRSQIGPTSTEDTLKWTSSLTVVSSYRFIIRVELSNFTKFTAIFIGKSYKDKGKIASSYGLYGHRDVNSTDCPGNALYNLLKSWSRWHARGTLPRTSRK